MKFYKYYFLLIVLSIGANCYTQEADYSLAKVGEKIHGVYIFMRCEPHHEYDYIATIKVKVNWSGTLTESFEKAIHKAKKKYPYFNGMIFRRNDFTKVDLIKFKGLEVSRGGFQIGEYVSFIDGYGTSKMQQIGEVIELETLKNKASVKYIDVYGDEKIKTVNYGDLTPLTKEDYEVKHNDYLKEISKYKFKIGEKVSWVLYSKQYVGEVIGLDDKFHKASVKYIDEEDNEKVSKVPYLKLTKIK